ncbi:alpha/beta hydrolase [Micromonospora ureilytica]|uniref:alpha/beta hydrolase n=1 Tax=Micromonospora ureilytica TaxID=709868 RepID=UPI0033EC8672
MPTPPTGLAGFYEQELDYGACKDFAVTEADAKALAIKGLECAWLTVPLDYEEPTGKTIELGVLRVRADGDPIGSLVLNPGGPAAPGVSFAAKMATTAGYLKLYNDFDLVGFDMRGTGSSTPAVDCFTDAERDDDELLASFLFGGETWGEDKTRQVARTCAKGSGGDEVISHLGSRDTARDMDVLRAVLGDSQLNFMGASYGTRLGAVYAEMFPGHLRAMVLDGGMDPNLGISDRMVQQYTGFQRSFDAWATACAAAGECPVGDDPAQATAKFQQLVRPLIDDPVPGRAGRELTYRSAVEAVLRSLYSQKVGWPAITQGLTELAAGRGDSLLAARDGSQERAGDGSYSQFLEGALATHCNDRERFDPQQETQMRKRMLQAAPFMDDGRELQARDVCEHWPSEPTLNYPYAAGVDALPPTLVVSITGDPAAPHEGGVALANSLGSSLLTVEGEQHGVVFHGGSDCVNSAVADYLIKLKVPASDARCKL